MSEQRPLSNPWVSDPTERTRAEQEREELEIELARSRKVDAQGLLELLE